MAFLSLKRFIFSVKTDRLRKQHPKIPNQKRKKLQRHISGAFQLLVPRDRIELPTQGFLDQIFENPKMLKLQAVDSISVFQLTFGFVWNCLETFDLDGHNLGTVKPRYKKVMKK